MVNCPFSLNNKVKYYRKLRGMSQVDLAKAAYSTQNTISAIECGTYEPRLITAYCISRALRASIYDIWGLDYNV